MMDRRDSDVLWYQTYAKHRLKSNGDWGVLYL